MHSGKIGGRATTHAAKDVWMIVLFVGSKIVVRVAKSLAEQTEANTESVCEEFGRRLISSTAFVIAIVQTFL